MVIRILFLIILLNFSRPLTAQRSYALKTIKQLTSDKFHGRGYYQRGDHKASVFIMKEMRDAGVLPVKNNYFQDFTFPVNTFPGKMKVTLGTKALIPGRDFIVSPACPTIKGTFPLVKVAFPVQQYYSGAYENAFLVVDKSSETDSLVIAAMDSLMQNPPNVKGVVAVEPKKLTWSVSVKQNDIALIRVLIDNYNPGQETITVDIKNKLIDEYKARNVIGLIPGTTNSDSFLVFTAHYDHLGRMGKNTIFPGANDNASGTAMILDLARHYSLPANRPAKSLLFIAFAGEEAGLIGSKFYTDHPTIPLSHMSFLINLDLMGNGEDGLMVVNGEIHPDDCSILEQFNKEHDLLKTIGRRGKARNSDHFWFSEHGVPAFFFYTMGGSTAYHDIYDVNGSIALSEYEDIKTLIQKFVEVKGK